MTTQIKEHWQNYIDGEWVDGSTGQTIPIINPATGEQVAEIARATPDDVDRAVAAARDAYNRRTLYEMRPAQRGELMLEISQCLARKELSDFSQL